MAAHAGGDHSLQLAETAMAATKHLDSHLNALYSDFVFAFLSDAAPQTLEQLMDLSNYEFKSEFARKYVAIGRTEGARAMLPRRRVRWRSVVFKGRPSWLRAAGVEVAHKLLWWLA